MNEEEKNISGDDAPLTALKVEDEVLEEPKMEVEEAIEEEAPENPSNETPEEDAPENPSNETPEETTESVKKETPEETGQNIAEEAGPSIEKKIRFSGAARKRFRYYIALGLSKEEAREKAAKPIGTATTMKGGKREGSTDTKKSKSTQEERGIKLCVVLEKFPDELLSPEQLKTVQEAIMDKILEIGQEESTTKPKFHSSTHQLGSLAIMCADKATVDWLKNITPTLKPWEEASLKALEDREMPHPETYVAFLPDSQDYTDEKILKLLEAQNDNLNVSQWKVMKRETVGSEVEVTFSIDRKFGGPLKKAGCKANYKFGHVQLWPKDRKPSEKSGGNSKSSKSDASGSKFRRSNAPTPKGSPRRFRPPPRSPEWRRAPSRSYERSDSRSEWRGRGRGVTKSYRSPTRGSDFRSSGSQQNKPWYEGPRGSSYKEQGQRSWFTEPWKPWKI